MTTATRKGFTKTHAHAELALSVSERRHVLDRRLLSDVLKLLRRYRKNLNADIVKIKKKVAKRREAAFARIKSHD